MTRKALMLLTTVALMVVAATAVAAAATPTIHTQSGSFSKATRACSDSGVHGTVLLFQLRSEGTQIVVFAKGLKPDKRYVSLYYDNDHCALEPYSEAT